MLPAALLAICVSIAAPKSPDSMSGAWLGHCEVGGRIVYVTVYFRSDGGRLTGELARPVDEAGGTHQVTAPAGTPDGATAMFEVRDDGLTFVGIREAGALRGQVLSPSGVGKFELLRMAAEQDAGCTLTPGARLGILRGASTNPS